MSAAGPQLAVAGADARCARPGAAWTRERNRAVSLYDPYGWRAKLGLIIPSTNTVAEHEWHRMAPRGVSISTARVLLEGAVSQQSFDAMAQRTELAAQLLQTAELDVVAYACTAGSFLCARDQITQSIARLAGCPAITASESVLQALARLGVQRVAVGTPYVDAVNEREIAFLEAAGLEVVRWYGLGLGDTQEERRSINRVPPEAIVRLARAIDHPDAQAIFISCTAVAAAEVIDEIERASGKPVVTSNQATFWRALRAAAINDGVSGYGRLLTLE